MSISDGFFNRGLTTAVFRSRGKMPVVRDMLMMFVMVGRGCQSFHKEAWWEWDQVHKTWRVNCWLFFRQIHHWQAQMLATTKNPVKKVSAAGSGRGRYRRSWLVASCRLKSAERFHIRGAEQERMKRLKRAPYDEGDAPAFCAGPPSEREKERTEYPGGARSSILASSPAGRSQVSVSSMVSMLSWMKVDMSDLLRDDRRILHWRGRQGVCFRLRKNQGECEAAVCEGDAAREEI